MKTLETRRFGKVILGTATVKLLKSDKRNIFLVQVKQCNGSQSTFEIKEESDALIRFGKCCEYALKKYGKYITTSEMIRVAIKKLRSEPV